MRHVFHRIEVLVLRRHFHATAPTIRAAEVFAVGIRNICPVDLDRIIVKSLVQGPRVADPRSVVSFGKGAAIFEADSHALGLWRNDAEFDPAFGFHLWVLFSTLVGRRGLPVIDWGLSWRWSILGEAESAGRDRCKG